MRVVEIALRHLSKRLHMQIHPKDTWGMILGKIDPKIQAMPDKTSSQKMKKSRWSEARANLFHVKQAWRDNSMHGNTFYTQQQAKDVFNAVRVFVSHLATL